jgi:hypothetical protein
MNEWDETEETFICEACGETFPLDFEGCIARMCDECCAMDPAFVDESDD